MLNSVLTFLFGSGVTIAIIVTAILTNPEKAEKWFALFWKAVMRLHLGLRFAHKKFVQHDFQGNVNEFVKKHAKEMPGFQVKGVKLEWVEGDVKRQAFLEADRVVVRVKRDDPTTKTSLRPFICLSQRLSSIEQNGTFLHHRVGPLTSL